MREVGILKPKPKEHVVTCFCGSLMKLRWAAKYQNWFYGCIRFPDCKGAHGCHPDGKPLGKPAPPEVKKWRIAAHEIFDRLWKNEGANMKGYKVFTHDLRPPIQGGEPVWNGKVPFELPEVKLDESDEECSHGWNFTEDIKTGLTIAGFWPNGRPSRVFEVEAIGKFVQRKEKIRADKLLVLSEVKEDGINDAIKTLSEKWFGSLAEEMTQSQILWREALGRPLHKISKIEEGLKEALEVRGLKKWKLKKFKTARAARDARDARDARAALAAWAAWAARDAWDAIVKISADKLIQLLEEAPMGEK